MPSAQWAYEPVSPKQVRGRGTVEDNFTSEYRSLQDILIREAIQNPLDVRLPGSEGPVVVKFRVVKGSSVDQRLGALIGDDFVTRLNASSGSHKFARPSEGSVLVIEDFNTTGLEGIYTDADALGEKQEKQNWNAFWFNEGEGAKPTAGSNGRAGQGKITFYRMSQVRAIFGLTVRASDGKKLLLGRSSFRRTYPFDGRSFQRDSFWCVDKGTAIPEENASEIAQFAKDLGVSRTHESGTTIIIPYPHDFVEQDAVRAVITDFYFPIARNRLAVQIGDIVIDQNSIAATADMYLSDDKTAQLRSFCTKGFRGFMDEVIGAVDSPSAIANEGWHKTTAISEASFPEGAAATIQTLASEGKLVSVRFPVPVRPAGVPVEKAYFDVYLKIPEDLAKSEEAYIRRDLLIGQELHISRAPHLPPARGLTLIEYPALSALMADAEEPTHMKWNASRPRLGEDYDGAKETVSAVRQAMPRLLAFLTNAAAQRDTKALAGYFSIPIDTTGSKGTGKEFGKGKKEVKQPVVDPPPPTPRPFHWTHGATWDQVSSHVLGKEGQPKLPVSATIQVAYQGLDDDAFNAYDPFDFDLSDATTHPITASGCHVISRAENRVVVEIDQPQFALKIDGFDPNIRRKNRIDYQETQDAADVIEQ